MNKKINIFLWWSFWIIYLELIYRIFVLNNIISISTLTIFIFSIPFILFFSFITSIFNEKVNRFLTIFLSCFIMILFLAQIVYFNFYNSIFSIFSLFSGGTGQVFQFLSAIIKVIISIWYVFLLAIIPFVIFIVFRNKFNHKNLNYKQNIGLLASYILITVLLVLFDNSLYSYSRLLFKTNAPLLTTNKTGLLTMEVLDLNRLLFGFKDNIDINYNESDKTYNNEEYNVLDIDFIDLINNETDKNIVSIHKYFNNVIPSKKNEYTGILKNKNIILIAAESFDSIAIDEKLTPTLYKISNNSFVFNNYYQPLYPISTYDGEYQILTSLIPKEGVWSLRKNSNNTIPYVYGNMFKSNGYNTYAFHNYVYSFYERELSHPKYGFEYIACGNGLENKMNCNNWPNSDLELIDATKEYLNGKFAMYYLTVSGHLDYNFKRHYISIKNKELVDNTNYSNRVKAYLASQIELDKALEELIKYLEETNQLDDTLIVITPDHYPYGLSGEELNEISTKDRKDKFENHHTTLIMYNPKIKKTIVDKYVSSLDILPTIYNLFGLNYDSRLFMGRDMLNDEEGIIILSDRSWITNKGSYNSITNKFMPFNSNEIDKEYIDEMNNIVNEKFSISSMIIDYDYYGKLGL